MTTRILSLDDEPEMGELIQLILGRKGYELRFSSSSYEAWAMLHAEPCDLFMQDLMRPDVDGWKFYQAVEADKALRSLPTMVVSARARDLKVMGLASFKIGEMVDGYVTKPFGPHELLDAIGDVLRKYGKSSPAEGDWKALQRMSDRPLETLSVALQDPDPGKRRRAIRALTLRNECGAVDLLIGALNDEDRDVQMSTIHGLELIGGLQAIDPLIEMLSGKTWQVRASAARALGRLRDDRAVEPLVGKLRDESCYVRLLATVGLGRIGDKRARKTISLMTSDEDNWVRGAAAEALKRISKSNQAARMEKLLESNSWHRKEAARFLPGANNKRVFDYLINALQNKIIDVRHAAVSSLGHLRDRYAVEPLIAMLQDENAGVRVETIRALTAIGDRRAAGPVADRLLDKEVTVRREAARVLGFFRDKCATELLTAVLEDNDKEVRDKAAFSLKLLGDVWSEEEGV